jgi:hypothetical protein
MSLSSIVETRAFAREASSLLEEDEIEDLKVFLAKKS